MKTGIRTRAAEPRDLKALVALCDALNFHSGLTVGRLDVRRFRAAMFGKRAFLFGEVAECVEEEPRLIGYALSHDSFTTDFGERGLYMVDLYVEAGCRRSGAGRRLIASVAARARSRGATHLWWSSMPGNLPARRFYASIGATNERLHTHALFGKSFASLAAEGARSKRRNSRARTRR